MRSATRKWLALDSKQWFARDLTSIMSWHFLIDCCNDQKCSTQSHSLHWWHWWQSWQAKLPEPSHCIYLSAAETNTNGYNTAKGQNRKQRVYHYCISYSFDVFSQNSWQAVDWVWGHQRCTEVQYWRHNFNLQFATQKVPDSWPLMRSKHLLCSTTQR